MTVEPLTDLAARLPEWSARSEAQPRRRARLAQSQRAAALGRGGGVLDRGARPGLARGGLRSGGAASVRGGAARQPKSAAALMGMNNV